MYRYETHLHTTPVSRCGRFGVRENLSFYKRIGYDGVFITNHFLDGNINMDPALSYAERLDFYFSDYREGVLIGEEIGLKVFLGLEISDDWTDFLIYGVKPDVFYKHPEYETLAMSEKLTLLHKFGAFIVHAHPFKSMDYIKLYPKYEDGVEIVNACRTDFENEMAKRYAEHYSLIPSAGSDNHFAAKQSALAGLESETPIHSPEEFISAMKERRLSIFYEKNPIPKELR